MSQKALEDLRILESLGVLTTRFYRIPAKQDDDQEPPAPARRAAPAGRNDPCPCGSGKKYKRCCR